jgi:membrane dipeptidase
MAIALDAALEERAARLHERAIIVDALGWALIERPSAIIDGRDQIDRAVDAGVTASNQYLASYHLDDFDAAIHKFWRYYGLAEVRSDRTMIVESLSDILQAKAERKLGLIMGFQGASPIEDDVAYLTIFKKLGLRIMGIAYDQRNLLGYGCREPEDRGLTAFGINAIKEANRLGILIDGSHTGVKTSIDAMKVSSKPVVFTHSNVRALTEHQRNLTDEQIDLIGECNGVIGISTHSTFVRRQPGVRPSLDDLIDHIEYIIKRIGVDHVGVGTDMVNVETLAEKVSSVTFTRIVAPGFHTDAGGGGRFVEDFDSVEGFSNLTRGLIRRGYSDEDILKILGGNWLRVFRDVWGG